MCSFETSENPSNISENIDTEISSETLVNNDVIVEYDIEIVENNEILISTSSGIRSLKVNY